MAEAVRATLAALGDKGGALPAGSVSIDTSAFAADRDADAAAGGGVRKLGLGSSAATAACAVGAVLEMAGLPIATHRDLAFSLAESAHRAWQGGAGSGADVAAAVYGGVLQFARPGGGTPVVRAIPGGLGTLQLVVFSSRTAVSTTNQIRIDARLRRARARIATTGCWRRCARPRSASSSRWRHATRARPSRRRARPDWRWTRSARPPSVPIVTPPFARAAALAAELGGAAKPSGAGGGDVGVALFPDRAAAQTFIAARRGRDRDGRRRATDPRPDDRRERTASPERRHRDTGAPCLSKVHESLAFID